MARHTKFKKKLLPVEYTCLSLINWSDLIRFTVPTMHLLQVTLKLLKTPLLKNNPTCFDLSRSSSGIHFLVELLLFSL